MSTSVLLSKEKSGQRVEFSGQGPQFGAVLCSYVGVSARVS